MYDLTLDTNVILRYIFQDISNQAEIAQKIFQKIIQNEIVSYIPEAVIVESFWVMKSPVSYKLNREEACEKMYPIINHPNCITTENKQVYNKAMQIYALHNIDFTDALVASYAHTYSKDSYYSFDEGMYKISEIQLYTI